MKNVAILIVVSLSALTGCGADVEPPDSSTPLVDAKQPSMDGRGDTSANDTDKEDAKQQLADEDARMTKIVPGVWETDRDGRRILTVHEDGTALMDVTVEGAYAYVVGSKMKFNIRWKIADGSLDFEMIDGEPKTSVDAVISLYGKSRIQKILEFTDKKFVLKDNDGDEDHVWTRVTDEAKGAATDNK